MTRRLQGIDPSLYFITDTGLCRQAGRSVAQTAAAAVAGGAGMVQVRDKRLDDQAFHDLTLDVIAAVGDVARALGRRVPVVINDRVHVARRLLDEGHAVHVHVGQSDMPVPDARRILGAEPLLGLSVVTASDLPAAALSAEIDLIGIGPVFATGTKADAGLALGVRGLRELVTRSSVPALAIGGIDAGNAGSLHGSGVVGICVISAICLAPDPAAAAQRLYAAFRGRPA